MFKLQSELKPTGDQPGAIKKITENIKRRERKQVLLGVTGSGKTFTAACVIEKIQRPVLIISHNKTLAAQLYQEFKEFFPENGVHYFVSYYDYYQPEAYIPQTDTYIEKDAKINQEIDKLRHAAVQDVLSRRDVLVVASVSCIYNIGSPENYQKTSLALRNNQEISKKKTIECLIDLQYQRNDVDFKPGTFRVRGDTLEVFVVTGEKIIRVEFLRNKIEQILTKAKNKDFKVSEEIKIYPAQFWMPPQGKLKIAIENIRAELTERLKELKKEGKDLEAQRVERRTNYDLEMLGETGYCHGIENYSRHLEFREPGAPPFSLLSYFPKDYLTFIDESHMTIPQLHAMYNTDLSRKNVLIEHGFRLKSARDNRPLNFKEVEERLSQQVFVSATPGPYEKSEIESKKSKLLTEQIIRPTGLLEPSIEIRPTENQVRDLIEEIKKRIKKKQRILAVTLTKRLAEELSEYLEEKGIKTNYLHSEVKVLERPQILEKLRRGQFDVVVGINLLREGLDLPEVALVAILDADKEGFLRNETTLIQTMGRAARHSQGHVILYADELTGSIGRAQKEIERRREIQRDYNQKNNITPRPIKKEIRKWTFGQKKKEGISSEFASVKDKKLLEKEMKKAAKNLNFERAAEIRDIIKKLPN